MNTVITSKEALRTAINYADLENVSPVCESVLLQDGLYEIVLRTLLMRYEFYVDAISGEVLGFNNEPETLFLQNSPISSILCLIPAERGPRFGKRHHQSAVCKIL